MLRFACPQRRVWKGCAFSRRIAGALATYPGAMNLETATVLGVLRTGSLNSLEVIFLLLNRTLSNMGFSTMYRYHFPDIQGNSVRDCPVSCLLARIAKRNLCPVMVNQLQNSMTRQ